MSARIDREQLSKELESVESTLLDNQNAFVELCINNSAQLLDAFTKEKALKDSVTSIKHKLDTVHTTLNDEKNGAFVRLDTKIHEYQEVCQEINYLESLKDTLETLHKLEQKFTQFDAFLKQKDYKNVMKTLSDMEECISRLPPKSQPTDVMSPTSKRLKKKKAEQTEYPPILETVMSRYEQCKQQVSSSLQELWKENALQEPTQLKSPYNDFLQALEKFKAKLSKLGLLDSDANTFSQQFFQTFANNLETHFIQELCQAYLVKSREIMKNKDYATIQLYDIHFSTYLKDFDFTSLPPEEHKESDALNKKTIYEKMADESNKEFTKYILGTYDVDTSEFLFVFPRCLINTTTKNLFGLIHNILKQACQSPLKWYVITNEVLIGSAEPLVHTTRQIFELYLLLVPQYHASNIADIPQIGMTFYNDCQFLAYQIHSLFPLYRSQLPAELHGKVSWLDFVPLFRREAEHCLANLLKRQNEFLVESLNFSEGLHDTQHAERYELVQKAMNQINHKLNQFAKVAKVKSMHGFLSCQDVLPMKIYKNLVGELLDGILSKIILQVLKLKDIAEEECNKLHTLLQIVQKSKALFAQTPSVGTPKPLNEKELELEIIQYAPAWSKYKKFCNLLILKLVEIENNFDSAHYSEFHPSEIQHMVEALFSDTPNRKRLLDKIAANK